MGAALGEVDGEAVTVGGEVGWLWVVGPGVGAALGAGAGAVVGAGTGSAVGAGAGAEVGDAVVGTIVGLKVGFLVGAAVGATVGATVGSAVGETVGSSVGSALGECDGARVGPYELFVMLVVVLLALALLALALLALALLALAVPTPVGATLPLVGENVGTTVESVELSVLNNVRRRVLLLPEAAGTYTLGAKLGPSVDCLRCRGWRRGEVVAW